MICFGGVSVPAVCTSTVFIHHSGMSLETQSRAHACDGPCELITHPGKMRNISPTRFSIYHHFVSAIILGFYSCATWYFRNESNSTHVNREQHTHKDSEDGHVVGGGGSTGQEIGRSRTVSNFCPLTALDLSLYFF